MVLLKRSAGKPWYVLFDNATPQVCADSYLHRDSPWFPSVSLSHSPTRYYSCTELVTQLNYKRQQPHLFPRPSLSHRTSHGAQIAGKMGDCWNQKLHEGKKRPYPNRHDNVPYLVAKCIFDRLVLGHISALPHTFSCKPVENLKFDMQVR